MSLRRRNAVLIASVSLAVLLAVSGCDDGATAPRSAGDGLDAVHRTADAASDACVAWDAQPPTTATAIEFSTSPGGGFDAGERITASAGPPVSNAPTPSGITMTIGGSVVDSDGFPGALEHTFAAASGSPTTIRVETDNLADARWTFTCQEKVIRVKIDVRPSSRRNPVSPRSGGRLPVAVLTDGGFDASRVEPSTVTLGDGSAPEAPVARRGNGAPLASLQDVDGDGDRDLLLHFPIRDLVGNGDLDRTTTSLELNGETSGGTSIRGSDGVRPVGGGRP